MHSNSLGHPTCWSCPLYHCASSACHEWYKAPAALPYYLYLLHSVLYPHVLQLREHNQQISELQVAWERSKVEEEQKGGGAADVRRWASIRSIVEARDLLKTVFRTACDQRYASMTLTSVMQSALS